MQHRCFSQNYRQLCKIFCSAAGFVRMSGETQRAGHRQVVAVRKSFILGESLNEGAKDSEWGSGDDRNEGWCWSIAG